MPTGDQRKIRELFDAATSLPVQDREAWLRSQQASPETLLAVSRLLQSSTRLGSFLAEPAIRRSVEPGREGRRIGPYRVLREIAAGVGGMGIVYLCERDDNVFRKLVAVKIIRADYNSAEMIAKFHAERQTLANLDHRNIARILDGGTTAEGLPYLVLDYIDGEPIDAFCNNRKASLTQRLNLTRQICAAVTYLHTNRVLHRDLKPSNILVAKDGVVKILDFGIAKPLDLNLEATATGLPLMTPGYASPEQLRARLTTPASDVYSLGAVIYLLLTGRRPLSLEGKSITQVIEAVTEETPRLMSATALSARAADISFAVPVPLSRWSAGLEGDLDRIVAMTLRKEPERRYSSVAALAEDLRRFQEGEPVLARGNAPAYIAAKYIVRHRVPMLAGFIVAAALSVAGVCIDVAYREHRKAEEISRRYAPAQVMEDLSRLAAKGSLTAGQQSDFVKARATQLQTDYEQQLVPMLGSPLAPKRVMSATAHNTVGYLGQLVPYVAQDPTAVKELADAYLTVSRLQWQKSGKSLNDPQSATVTAEAAQKVVNDLLESPRPIRLPDAKTLLALSTTLQKAASQANEAAAAAHKAK